MTLTSTLTTPRKSTSTLSSLPSATRRELPLLSAITVVFSTSRSSAARFDDEFLANRCKLVVDNYKLYEAWEEEYPYPSYKEVQIIGTKFTDLKHEGKIKREDIIDIADIITGKHPGRESDDEIIVYSVGGMPVEDIAWGGTIYRNALEQGIGIELPLWDKPDMA